MKKFQMTGISVCLLLPLVMIMACNAKSKKPGDRKDEKKQVTADAIVIKAGVLENRVFATGTLLASEEVELRSEVSGRVISINFQEGSHVNKGDLLVKFDDRELQSQLKKLLLEEKLASNDVSRKQKLLEIKAISQEEFDISKNQSDIIQASMELTRTQISKTEIRAPFGGKVGLRQVSVGGYLTPEAMISTLQQIDPIKVEFTVPEKYSEKLTAGSTIQFRVEGKDKLYSGKVYVKDPQINVATRSLTLRALCPNPGNGLMPGAFAKIDVLLGTLKNAVTVPSEAIIPVIDGEKVMMVKDGMARSRKIETGLRTEQVVQVLDGLQPNDTVLVSGLMMLKDDMKVKARVKSDSIAVR